MLVSETFDYFCSFLRVAKYRPAAVTMITQPPMVKIVVPIPPVEGRSERLVFGIEVSNIAVPDPSVFSVIVVAVVVVVFSEARYAG